MSMIVDCVSRTRQRAMAMGISSPGHCHRWVQRAVHHLQLMLQGGLLPALLLKLLDIRTLSREPLENVNNNERLARRQVTVPASASPCVRLQGGNVAHLDAPVCARGCSKCHKHHEDFD